jgi:putative FmdB family regulatory protein
MPLYSYRCNDCGHEFDVRQRMADKPLEECPVCQGSLRRLVGSVGVVFKGKGFYVTDHRTSNGGSRAATADTKPDAKTETPKTGAAESSKPADVTTGKSTSAGQDK